MLCYVTSPDFFHMEAYSMSVNMENFKINRFPSVNSASKKRKRVLLKDGKPVTEPRKKEKSINVGPFGIGPSGTEPSSSTRSATSHVPKRVPIQKQLKKMSEAQ